MAAPTAIGALMGFQNAQNTREYTSTSARAFPRSNIYLSLMIRHYLWFSTLAVILFLSVITATNISLEISEI